MKTKRIWALLLASVMTVSAAMAGCGGNSGSGSSENTAGQDSSADSGAGSDEYSTEIDMEEEPYTVAIQVVTLPGTEYEGEEDREAAINAIAEPLINCRVDIQEVWISELANTTSMAVAGDEKIDLVHVGTVNPLSALVGSDILLDMNEKNLLQNRGQKLIELKSDTLQAGNVNGRQLAVPAKTFNAVGKGILYNKTMAEACGIEIPEKITFDELNDILYAVHDANPDVMAFFSGTGENLYLTWLQSLETFGNLASYGVVLDAKTDPTVVNLFETDLYKDYCLQAFHWTQDGIQPGDPTDTNTAQDYFYAQNLFCVVGDINPSTLADWGSRAANSGFELDSAMLVDPVIINSSVTEYMWGIATNCQRPDKAMDFLNLLYSNEEIANILKYGIEGVNYDFAEGSETVVVPNGSYEPMFYSGGDEHNMLIKSPAKEDYLEQWQAMEESASMSLLCNYMFDDSAYQTESSVILSTIKEYVPRLSNGMCESEEATLALIDEFVERLKAAGIDDVIAGNQEQINAYLEAQQQSE